MTVTLAPNIQFSFRNTGPLVTLLSNSNSSQTWLAGVFGASVTPSQTGDTCSENPALQAGLPKISDTSLDFSKLVTHARTRAHRRAPWKKVLDQVSLVSLLKICEAT